ncbi:hypothetical protein PHYSODRAFT_502127, partial [Phytophthora sojae]
KLIRMHFVDAQAPESLEDMLSVFKASYEANRQEIDSLLLTATLWNLECDSELLPTPGTIVDINKYINLQLYNDTQCQLTTRLGQHSWEQTDL